MTTLQDRRGNLTAYGLACGYVQRRWSGDVVVTMWKEHGAYHVRGVYYRTDRKGDRAFWQAFGKLKEARKCFYEPNGKKVGKP